jgi:hypothetical protein
LPQASIHPPPRLGSPCSPAAEAKSARWTPLVSQRTTPGLGSTGQPGSPSRGAALGRCWASMPPAPDPTETRPRFARANASPRTIALPHCANASHRADTMVRAKASHCAKAIDCARRTRRDLGDKTLQPPEAQSSRWTSDPHALVGAHGPAHLVSGGTHGRRRAWSAHVVAAHGPSSKGRGGFTAGAVG